MIRRAVSEAWGKDHLVNQTEPDDRTDIGGASEFTSLSRSYIYKRTRLGTIPVRRLGTRLVFSKRELKEWMEEKTI